MSHENEKRQSTHNNFKLKLNASLSLRRWVWLVSTMSSLIYGDHEVYVMSVSLSGRQEYGMENLGSRQYDIHRIIKRTRIL